MNNSPIVHLPSGVLLQRSLAQVAQLVAAGAAGSDVSSGCRPAPGCCTQRQKVLLGRNGALCTVFISKSSRVSRIYTHSLHIVFVRHAGTPRRGLCPCWRSGPPLTLWRFPEVTGRSAPARRGPRSSWRTKVRAHCWDTYSGNTSSPRSSTRSADWARYGFTCFFAAVTFLKFIFNCFSLFIYSFKSQLVKQICDQTDCNSVVDVGSGQVPFYFPHIICLLSNTQISWLVS